MAKILTLAFKILVLVSQPQQVSDSYVSAVLNQVKAVYRHDLHIRTRFRTRTDYRIDPLDFSLDERTGEFITYSKILRRRGWTKLVLRPAYFDADGNDWSAGLGSWFALATIRGVRLSDGADRFNVDWVGAAHELAHTLGAKHTAEVSVMHPDALAYASPDLRFLAKTKKEIKNFLEERVNEPS